MNFILNLNYKYRALFWLGLVWLATSSCRSGHFEERAALSSQERLRLELVDSNLVEKPDCDRISGQKECHELSLSVRFSDSIEQNELVGHLWKHRILNKEGELISKGSVYSDKTGLIEVQTEVLSFREETADQHRLFIIFNSEFYGLVQLQIEFRFDRQSNPITTFQRVDSLETRFLQSRQTRSAALEEVNAHISQREMNTKTQEKILLDIQFKVADESSGIGIQTRGVTISVDDFETESIEIKEKTDSAGYVHFQVPLLFRPFENTFLQRLDIQIQIDHPYYSESLEWVLILDLSEDQKNPLVEDFEKSELGNRADWRGRARIYSSEASPQLKLTEAHSLFWVTGETSLFEISLDLHLKIQDFDGVYSKSLHGLHVEIEYFAAEPMRTGEFRIGKAMKDMNALVQLGPESRIHHQFELDNSALERDFWFLLKLSVEELPFQPPAYFLVSPVSSRFLPYTP